MQTTVCVRGHDLGYRFVSILSLGSCLVVSNDSSFKAKSPDGCPQQYFMTNYIRIWVLRVYLLYLTVLITLSRSELGPTKLLRKWMRHCSTILPQLSPTAGAEFLILFPCWMASLVLI